MSKFGRAELSGALATSGSTDCETTSPGADDPSRYLPTVGGTVGGVVGGVLVGGDVVGGGVVAGWVVPGAVVGGAGVVGGDVDDGGRGAAVVATGVGDVGFLLTGTVSSTTLPGTVVGRACGLVPVSVVCCVVATGAVEAADSP